MSVKSVQSVAYLSSGLFEPDIRRSRMAHTVPPVPHIAVDQHKEFPESFVLVLQYTDFFVVTCGQRQNLPAVQPRRNLGLRELHAERWTVNNDLVGLDARGARNRLFRGLTRFQIV